MASVSPSWADLPMEILSIIGLRLKTCLEVSRFRAVCTSWRSSTSPLKKNKFPMSLRLPDPHNPNNKTTFDLIQRTIYRLEPQSPTSPKCWIIAVEDRGKAKLHLLNPFTGYRIKPLPDYFPRVLDLYTVRVTELTKLFKIEHSEKHITFRGRKRWIQKVILLPNSSHDDQVEIIVMLNLEKRLSLFNLSTQEYITFTSYLERTFKDIASYKDKLCAIDTNGWPVLLDRSLKVLSEIQPPPPRIGQFLVESSGELLLVERNISRRRAIELHFDRCNASWFDLHELILWNEMLRFREITTHRNNLVVINGFLEHEWFNEIQEMSGSQRVTQQDYICDWVFCLPIEELPKFEKSCFLFMDFTRKHREHGFRRCFDEFRHHQNNPYSPCFYLFVRDENMELLEHFPRYANTFWPPPHWVLENPEEWTGFFQGELESYNLS